MSVGSRTRHGQMVTLRKRRWRLKDIGLALGVTEAAVIYHLNGRCACSQEKAWRSPERVRERCAYMRELDRQMPPLTLKEIALAVKERFGAEMAEGLHSGRGRPQNHSTILLHLKKRCHCETLRSWERTASTAPATKSPGESPGTS